MLLSSWLKKLVHRTRGRKADGKLKKKPSPFTQLGLTRLEDRVVLTVNAMLVGSELRIDLPDANDTATVEVVGTDVRVAGTSFVATNFAAASVDNIVLTGGAGTQTVSFDKAFSVLPDGIQATDGLLENLTFSGDITGVQSSGSIDITVGQLDLGGNLVTEGGTISIDAAITLMTDAVLDTTNGGASTGAAVTLDGSVDNDGSTRNLTIDAGSAGFVTLDRAIGLGGALGDVSITADDVAINNSIAANTVTLAPGGASSVRVGTAAGADFTVTDAELDQITATTSVSIGGTNATSVVLDGVTDPAGIPLLVLDAGDSGATFVSTGTASTLNSLQVTSDGGSTVNVGIAVDAGPLSITANDNNISVQALLAGTNGSDISLDAGTAGIALNQSIATVVSSDGGTLTFTARQVGLESLDGFGYNRVSSPGGTLNLIPTGTTQAITQSRIKSDPTVFYIPNAVKTSAHNVGTGFDLINIGRADGEHSITLSSVLFNDPVRLLAPVGSGQLVMTDGRSIGGAFVGLDDASLTADAVTVVINSHVTAPNGIFLGQETTINGNRTFTTSGGDIEIASLRTGNLILNPNGGDVRILGTSSGSPPDVTSLQINSAADVDFDGEIASSGNVVVSNTTGTVSLNSTLSAAALTITADDVDVGGAASISVTGTVTLRPDDDTDTIGLGTGAGTFTPGDLSAFVSAPSLIIGRTGTGTGAVDINGVNLSAATTDLTVYGGSIAVSDLNAGTNDVVLTAQTGAITDRDNSTTTDVTAGSLTLNSVSGIGADGVNPAIDIDATTVSATSSASGGVYLNSVGTGGLSITASAPDSVGVFGSTETVTLTNVMTTSGNVSASIGGNNVVAQTVTAGGTGDVRLETTGSGDITVNSVTAADDRVTLLAADALIDASGASTSVTADELRVAAGTGVGSMLEPFETTVSRLEADGNSGGVYIESTGNLTIGVASGDADDIVGVRATGGDIVLTVSSPLTVTEDIENSGGGNITLTSSADGGNDDHITVTGARVVASGGAGDITLNVGTDLIINDSGVANDIQNAGTGDIIANLTRDVLIGSSVDIVTNGGMVDLNSVRNFSLGSSSTIDASTAGGTFDLALTGTAGLAANSSISTDSNLTIANATDLTLAAGASLSTDNQLLSW